MEIVQKLCQIIIGLGILNVWLIRFNEKTRYRAGNATNMKEEFAAYGLPKNSVWIVGTIKIVAAISLLVGLAIPELVPPAAFVLAILMLSAIILHIRNKDPAIKSLPAATVFALTLFLLLS